MKTWKIMKIYKLTAETKTEALGRFGRAVGESMEDEMLETVIVKEDDRGGFFQSVKKQITG